MRRRTTHGRTGVPVPSRALMAPSHRGGVQAMVDVHRRTWTRFTVDLHRRRWSSIDIHGRGWSSINIHRRGRLGINVHRGRWAGSSIDVHGGARATVSTCRWRGEGKNKVAAKKSNDDSNGEGTHF